MLTLMCIFHVKSDYVHGVPKDSDYWKCVILYIGDTIFNLYLHLLYYIIHLILVFIFFEKQIYLKRKSIVLKKIKMSPFILPYQNEYVKSCIKIVTSDRTFISFLLLLPLLKISQMNYDVRM